MTARKSKEVGGGNRRLRGKAKKSEGTLDSKVIEVQQTAKKEAASFPIVGIGASAGGLAAFEAFFSAMPADADSGMGFVLVQHLAPDHKSILTDLIRRYTRMQVSEVEDGMAVKPNCAYIIPPNSDMNNLMASTGIGTIFVDCHLRILRFTPAITQVINLILTDVGRPVDHIVSNLAGYDRLVADVQAVLDSLVPKEVEVQTKAGGWFLLRIRPYRTLENAIEGAVITFVDVTEMKRLQEALREANALLRLAVVMHDAYDAITVQDMEGRVLAWNPRAERIYGWSEAEAMAMNIRDLIPEGLREEALAMVRQLSRAEVLKPYRTQRVAKDGRIVEVWLTATSLVNEAGEVYAIATTEREWKSAIRN
jgi:PAS domain S-box-containing protein